jgi:hypothetical protein
MNTRLKKNGIQGRVVIMRVSRQLALACGLAALLAGPAMAAEAGPAAAAAAPPEAPAETAPQRELWVNLGGFSHHFANSKRYNETNRGLGLEFRWSPELSVMAGSYYNSVRRTTTYAGLTYQPLTLGPMKVGASLGVMDGYPAVSRGGTFFAALPMATYEGSRFGFNLGLIPSMPKVDGAIVLQIKVRAL